MEEKIITKADLIASPNEALEEAKKETNGAKRYRKVLETEKKITNGMQNTQTEIYMYKTIQE